MKGMKGKKERFMTLLMSTERDGIIRTLEMLERIGFFKAPASTKFHLSKEGGLLEHSLNVCNMALDLRETVIKWNPSLEERLPVDSVLIASLLHDVCKADIYKLTTKKQRNDAGEWEDVPAYVVDHGKYPFGHGEKSVIILLQTGLKLTTDEALAIRWHMQAWDLPFQSYDIKGNLNKALEDCPLVQLIIAADGLASHTMESQ